MTKPDHLARHYVQFFERQLGIPARIDEDQDVVVEYGGLTLLVVNTAPRDPARLRLLAVLRTDNPAEEVARVALQATADLVLAKAVPVRDGVVVSVDVPMGADGCLPTPLQLSLVVPRCLRAVVNAAHEVFDHLTFLALTRDVDVDVAGVESAVAREVQEAE